jgi:hypothetical protein
MKEAKVGQIKRRMMTRHNYMISDAQDEALKAISTATKLSVSELVRQGIQAVIGEYKDVLRKEL